MHAFGGALTLHVGGEETGGRLALLTIITPPGGGPPTHYHLNEDECFMVEEGTMSFFCDGKWTDVDAGGVVFMPRTSIHTFKNNGNEPTRMTVTATPSGFEVFFAQCAEEFAKPGGPDMERIVAISAEHRIHYV